MYIVAIAWLYVALMMAITERTAVAAVLTFFAYGVAPVALVLYILGTGARKRRRKAREQQEAASPSPAGKGATNEAGSVSQPD